MGIFAVPKILLFLVGESQCFRVFDIQTFGKISCNQSIVVGGVDKYFRCQHFFGFGCRISVVFQLIDYQSIVFGIGDDRNEFVVFSSGPAISIFSMISAWDTPSFRMVCLKG